MEKEKIEFCLTAAEKAKELITDKEERALAEQAIARCRNWTAGKYDISEELYDCLDNEENGLTLFQERETDTAVIDAWNVIIDAVAYICRCDIWRLVQSISRNQSNLPGKTRLSI